MSSSRLVSPQGPLNIGTRARLYAELAKLDGAGLPVDRVRTIAASADPAVATRALRAAAAVAKGQNLSDAGRRTGLFAPDEAELITAAAAAGCLTLILQRLAEALADTHRHARQLRNRLLLPTAVFGLGVFIAPLAALVTGELTVGAYLWRTVGFLLQIGGGS